MKKIFLLICSLSILNACIAPKYSVGECYSDGRNNYSRIVRINGQYKTDWYYELYVKGKDIGEFNMYTDELEGLFEFKRDCPK